MCGIVLCAICSLLLILKRTKQKKLLLKALKNNQGTFDSQFESDENQLKDALSNELSVKLTSTITEIISIEKDAYKKLCTLYIDYHPAAIELLPFTINQITSAYIDCIRKVILLVNEDKENEADVKLEEPLSQHEALIAQLRSEKRIYSDNYDKAHNVLNAIYLKYKEKLEIADVTDFKNMNMNEIAAIFNIESFEEK